VDQRHLEIFGLTEEDMAQAKTDREAALARGVSIVDYVAGALTHLYPEPGDIQRFLDEERKAWGDFDRRFDD